MEKEQLKKEHEIIITDDGVNMEVKDLPKEQTLLVVNFQDVIDYLLSEKNAQIEQGMAFAGKLTLMFKDLQNELELLRNEKKYIEKRFLALKRLHNKLNKDYNNLIKQLFNIPPTPVNVNINHNSGNINNGDNNTITTE